MMPPKRGAPVAGSSAKPKRKRKMMTIREKVHLLDMLNQCRSYAAVARHYAVNESTVRHIKKDEVNIRKTAAISFNKDAKRVRTPRNKRIMQMEATLALWVADCRKKDLSLNTNMIRTAAKSLYDQILPDDEDKGPAEDDPDEAQIRRGFKASKGWFDKFQKRYGLKGGLKGVSLSGDAASGEAASGEAAYAVEEDFLKLISDDEGCHPDQVCDTNQTGKPSLTFLIKDELFSSGLYCQDSPVDDSLCGFPVEDVEKEIRRGNRLSCHRCTLKGATVGCEVKSCKRTYHYPCARKDGAQIIEDLLKGTYKVYCQKHGSTEKTSTEGQVPIRRALSFNGLDDAEAGPSRECHNHTSSKRSSSSVSNSKQEDGIPQQHSSSRAKRKRRMVIIESDSGEEENMVDMECAPLESDIDSSVPWQDAVSVPLQDPQRNNDNSDTSFTSGHSPHQKEAGDGDIPSDSDESQSLLLPVTILPSSQSTAAGSGPSPASVPASPPPCKPTLPSDPPGSPSTHATFPSSPEGCHVPTFPPSSNATLFWRSCNLAGCTADIFNSFISDLRDTSSRILTEQASQEDYDLALRVMEASGKLEFLVTEQRKGLERKQKDLQKSLAALKTVSSVLKR